MKYYKFALILRIFCKRALSLGQLLTEIASFMVMNKL